MIVVLIIGVLAAVALNSYRKHVVRANRTDAKSAMQDLAGREERYMYKNNTYTTDGAALNITAEFGGPNYEVTAVSATSIGYVIQARPLGRQLSEDKACQAMSLSSTGLVTIAGTGTVADCWGR
jgi:type IV pilus assembly protein PilE